MIRPLKLRRISFFSFLMILLIGCNKGCSYSNEIDAETKAVHVGSQNFKIEAALIEHGNTRRDSKSYTINMGVICGSQKTLGSTQLLDANYEVDLNKKLELASMRASDDEFTFQLLYNGYIIETFIYLKGRLLDSPYGNYGYDSNTPNKLNTVEPRIWNNSDYTRNGPKIEDVDINSYPSEADFLKNLITTPKVSSHYSNEKDVAHLSKFIEKMDLDDTELITFFSRWPMDNLVRSYFSIEKINQFKSKHPKWYQFAQCQIAESYRLNNKQYNIHQLVFEKLQDQIIIAKVDSAYIANELTHSIDWSNEDYIFDRLQDPTPFTPKLQKKVDEMCKSGIHDYFTEWPNKPQADLNTAIRYFTLTNNKEMVQEGIEILSTWPENKSDDPTENEEGSSLVRVANKCTKWLSPSARKIIGKVYLDHLEELNEFDKENVFDICDGVIPCDELMPIVTKHNNKKWGNNKSHYFKPKDC
jgi:hypothetical protein